MDNELKDMLGNIQNSIIALSDRVDSLSDTVSDLSAHVDKLDTEVSGIRITIENDISNKISVLYDAHLDEIRYRDEVIKVVDKVDNHEMRIDNLEKVYTPQIQIKRKSNIRLK